MAVIMGLPFMAGMVMRMGLKFIGLVLVDMSLFVSLMGMGMFVLVRMRVRMLMGVGMPVLLVRVSMRVFMLVAMFVLMFMGVVVFTFHMVSPPSLIYLAASMQFLSCRGHHQFPVLDPLHSDKFIGDPLHITRFPAGHQHLQAVVASRWTWRAEMIRSLLACCCSVSFSARSWT